MEYPCHAMPLRVAPLLPPGPQMNNTVATIRNVIASVEGGEEAERYVVVGNHRDAWTFGAADPNSGIACLLAVRTRGDTAFALSCTPVGRY